MDAYRNCQSCGMPLRNDPGGTNADGSKNPMYCSHCFRDGAFVLPDLTVAQMQERVKGKIRSMGFPGFLAGLFTRNIPKLERWRKAG
jgi:hypothetical protein